MGTSLMLKKSEQTLEKTYSYEEALATATDYFKGDTLAASVWVNKYALKDLRKIT